MPKISFRQLHHEPLELYSQLPVSRTLYGTVFARYVCSNWCFGVRRLVSRILGRLAVLIQIADTMVTS